jgi:hypothetical protein
MLNDDKERIVERAKTWCDETPCRYCEYFGDDVGCRIYLTIDLIAGIEPKRVEGDW